MSNISWRERLEQQPRLRDFDAWPVIPIDALPSGRRQAYQRNLEIIAHVLDYQPIQEVAQLFHLTQGRISQMLKRCLGGDEGDEPLLTEALIPNRVIVDKQRLLPLPTLAKTRKMNNSQNCCYKALLRDVPGLSQGLDDMILPKLSDKPEAQLITPIDFHGEFKRLLEAAHWPRDRYPYTSVTLVYESTRRYLHKRTAELQQERLPRQTSDPPRVKVHSSLRALQNIQIDEHKVDFRSSIQLQLNDELIPLRMARATLLVARDEATETNLGYYLAPTGTPNQQDMLALFEAIITPWQPLNLVTPGFQYEPGACFPSGLPQGFPISFGMVKMDNAWIHSARTVFYLLCEHFGSTINLGRPGKPKDRWLIESINNYFEKHLGHRPASTTGSHPTDPIKESRKNQKHPPVTMFETFNEATSIILSADNIKPRANLGGASSLALLQHHFDNHYVRYIPKIIQKQFQPFVGSRIVPVHWRPSQNELPYVYFHYSKYHGAALNNIVSHEKYVRIEFDRRDVRTIRIFTVTGVYLGELIVPKTWQRFAHSMATRAWLHKHAREYGFRKEDPLGDYFRWLLENRNVESIALSLLKVYTEFTRGIAANDGLILDDDFSSSYEPLEEVHSSSTRRWSTSMANSRK